MGNFYNPSLGRAKLQRLHSRAASPWGNPSLLKVPAGSAAATPGATLRLALTLPSAPPSSLLPGGIFIAGGSQTGQIKACLGMPLPAVGPHGWLWR